MVDPRSIMNQFNMIKIYTIFTQQQDTNSIQVLWGLFYQGTNPIHEGSTLMTYSPLKPLILSHWVLGFMNYGRQCGQPKAISTQMKNTSDSYLPGEPQPFLLTGSFFKGCWGILGGMGSISCCRAPLFADRSRDCPPMLPPTPLRHLHLDPSPSRGLLPRAVCPPHWPTLGPLLWAQSPSGCWSIWVTGSQRGLCSLLLRFPCSACHEWRAHEWRTGMHLEWKMWFSRGGWFLTTGGVDGWGLTVRYRQSQPVQGTCSVSGIWPWTDPSYFQIQC